MAARLVGSDRPADPPETGLREDDRVSDDAAGRKTVSGLRSGDYVAPDLGDRVEQRGRWFDELTVGTVYVHRPGRTVSEADNTFFSTLTMNPQALHLDAAWSASQPFGQRLVNSMFTLSTLVGLSVAQLSQGTIVGNLGFSEVTFPHPLFAGDTIYGETLVVDKRLSKSRPEAGIVTLAHTARNQNDEVVARATRQVMFLRAPENRS
jgi:acyl dehydratase